MLRAEILGERVALGLEQLHRLFRLQIISLGSDIREGHPRALLLRVIRRGGRAGVRSAGRGAIKILIEIELFEQIVLGLEGGVLLIQPNEISGGAIPFFLDETDVVLLLEFEHLVLAIAQIFLDLDELLRDRGGDVVPLVFTHPFFEIEILLHDRIQVGLGVIGRACR